MRTIKSLLRLSLECIAIKIRYNCFPINKLSTKGEATKLNGPKLSINPFHQLPTSLLEQIIITTSYLYFINVGSKPKNTTHVFEYLISPQLRFARFYDYTDEYLSFFPKFGKLLLLSLRSTVAGDKCLEVIGTYCKTLRMLDVVNCRNVTDTGVQLLCFNDGDLGMRNQGTTGLCKTLQHLLINCTGVTKHGVQIAVNNLTMLKFLAHKSIFEVLLEIIQTGLDHNLSKFHSFSFVRLLAFNLSPYKEGSLGQVLQFCPSLTGVDISPAKGLTDSDLASIMSLKNLVRFQLRPFFEENEEEELKITFIGGVVPLLKKFGKSLEVLEIICFVFVDIWTILKLCPNLTSLTFNGHCDSVTILSESELTLYRNEKEQLVLKNLKKLDCALNIPPEILHFLWSFPQLTEIYISFCDILTDEFLQNAVKCHKFKNLIKMDIRHCDFITKQGIDSLMTHSIEEIRIEFCENLTPRNVYDWQLRANREKWKLNLYFKNSQVKTLYRSSHTWKFLEHD